MPKRSMERLSGRLARAFGKLRHSDPGSMLASAVLTAIVVLGPLPFGSVLPRDLAALQVAAFLAFALALVSSRSLAPLAAVRWPLVALVAIAAIGLVQSMPWPSPLARLLAPGMAESWIETADLRAELATVEAPSEQDDAAEDDGAEGDGASFVPLSIAPAVSRQVALQWLAVAAALAAATIQGRERAARRLVLVGLVATATFQTVYGADLSIGREGTIWGVDVPGDTSRLRGTLVNADHFALLMAMAVVVSAAWIWWAARKSLGSQAGVEHQVPRLAGPVLAFGLFFVGLTFSGSRAGLLVIVATLLALGCMLALRYRRWQWALPAVALVALGGVGVGLIGFDRGLARWFQTSAYEITWSSRFRVWSESLELWWSSPLLGTGLGTFRQAYPQVQSLDLPGTWRHAHNDVLELLVTVGPIAWLLLVVATVALVRRAWHVFRLGRRSEDRAGAFAVLGVVVAAGLHSLVDFGLTIPANAFILAILVGLGCGASTLDNARRRTRQTVFLGEETPDPAAGENAEEFGIRGGQAPA